MSQQQQQQQQPYRHKLQNPTQYHLQQQRHSIPHPLSLYQPHDDYTMGTGTTQLHIDPTHTTNATTHDNDDFSQSFMSPLNAPLDELDDLDYQTGMNTFHQQHHRQSIGSYSMTQQQHSPTSSSFSYAEDPWFGSPPTYSELPIDMPPPPSSSSSSHHHSHYPQAPPGAAAMSAPANIDYNFSTSPPYYGDHHYHQHHPLAPPPQQTQKHSKSSKQQQSPDQQGAAAKSFEDDYTMQVNLQMIMEKRRRRRESHNAVERRRRDNINERIQELGTLLPDTMLEGHNNNGSNKPNKGVILRRSVDHIRFLQQEVHSYQQRIQQLESVLQSYQQR